MPRSLLRDLWRALAALAAILIVLILASFLSGGAWAQDASNSLPSGIFDNSGRFKVAPQPVIQVGKDSVTGGPCLVGFSGTCVGPSGGVVGGSLSAQANASAPSSAEGATTDPLSMDLKRQLRVLIGDRSGNPVSFSDLRQIDQVLPAAISNGAVMQSLDGSMAAWTVRVDGLTASGATLTSECTNNVAAASPTWFAKRSTLGVSVFTADGDMRFDIAGHTACRMRVSSTGTGNITLTYSVSGAQVPQPAAISSGALTPIIQGDAQAFLNMTTATTTKLISGVSGKKTYIVFRRWMAEGTTNEKLVTGSGTNCATGTTDLTETEALTAQVGFTSGAGLGPISVAGPGLDVCVVNGSAVNLHEYAFYTQF